MSEPERFDTLLKDYQKLLPRMRNAFGQSNCPLTAEAVWKFLKTGEVRPARAQLPGSTKMLQCGSSSTVTITQIRARLKKAGHGAHAVVTANPDAEKEHSFNVVNVRGAIYLVDAYNAQPVLTKNLEGHLRYAKKLEMTLKWDMHIVPSEMIASFRCPH